jgi:hypothetical protein
LSITFLFSLWRTIDVFSVLGKFVPERLAYPAFSDLPMVCGCYGKLEKERTPALGDSIGSYMEKHLSRVY